MSNIVEEVREWINSQLPVNGRDAEADALYCAAWANGEKDSVKAEACLRMIDLYCDLSAVSDDKYDQVHDLEELAGEAGFVGVPKTVTTRTKGQLSQSKVAQAAKCPKVFEWKTEYLNAPVYVDSRRPERSKSMLTRVAIVENKRDGNGNALTPEVIVPAEDMPLTSDEKACIRETMLIKHASKLKGKKPSDIKVVCSDFTAK